MTKPGRIGEERSNRTENRRAMEEPKVQELVDTLRRDWAAIGLPERGQQLCSLAALGCSTRGLGSELNQSATSIRRHMAIAGLPVEDRTSIERGASAKVILAWRAATDRGKRTQERVEEDRKTGVLSDTIATIILEFCRTDYDLRKKTITGRVFPILLNNVELLISKFEATGHRPVKAPKKLELRELLRTTRPRKAKNSSATLHQATWLSEWLWLIAPERQIRARAIQKARKRAGELLPKRTPIESWCDAFLNSLARNIELANLPRRKVYPGGARSVMLRQGLASLPPDPKGGCKASSKS